MRGKSKISLPSSPPQRERNPVSWRRRHDDGFLARTMARTLHRLYSVSLQEVEQGGDVKGNHTVDTASDHQNNDDIDVNDDDEKKEKKTASVPPKWNVKDFEDRDHRSKLWLMHSTKQYLIDTFRNTSTLSDEDLDRLYPLLLAWSRQRKQDQRGRVMQQILNQFVAQVEAGNPAAVERHDVRYYHVVMQACCCCDGRGGALPHVALEVLDMMERVQEKDGLGENNNNNNNKSVVRPTHESYQHVLQAFLQAAEAGGGDDSTSPADCLDQAVAILDRMEAAGTKQGDSSLLPTHETYNQVLYAMASCCFSCRRSDCSRIREGVLGLFDRMQTLAVKQDRPNVAPTIDTIDQVLKTWGSPFCADSSSSSYSLRRRNANNINEDEGEQALPLPLQEAQALMESLPERGLTPTTYTYNLFMTCWLRHAPRASMAARRITKLLDEMMASSSPPQDDVVVVRPDYCSLHTCVSAHVNAGDLYKAKSLVDSMETQFALPPKTFTYNLLLKAWSQRGNAREAKALLRHMERVFVEQGNRNVMPDSYSYTTVLDAISQAALRFSSSSSFRHKNNIKKGASTYAGKRHREEGEDENFWCPGLEAEDVLDQMEELHQKHGGQRPTISVWNALLHCWVLSSSAGGKKMVQRVENIFQHVRDCDVPNLVTYNTVLKAYSQEGAATVEHAVKADALLQWMERNAHGGEGDGGRRLVRPDATSFTSVITAYARSETEHKADAARGVLDRMIMLLHPQQPQGTATTAATRAMPASNVATFNACLSACARTNPLTEKPRAFRVATSTLRQLSQVGLEPNEMTFAILAKACAHLLPRRDELPQREAHLLPRRDELPQREAFLRLVFGKARRAGLVSPMLLYHFHSAVSPSVFWEQVRGGDRPTKRIPLKQLYQELPWEWKCQTTPRRHRKAPWGRKKK